MKVEIVKFENMNEANPSIVIFHSEADEPNEEEKLAGNESEAVVERSTNTSMLSVYKPDKDSSLASARSTLSIVSGRSMLSSVSLPFPMRGYGLLFLYATFLIFVVTCCVLVGMVMGKYLLCQYHHDDGVKRDNQTNINLESR